MWWVSSDPVVATHEMWLFWAATQVRQVTNRSDEPVDFQELLADVYDHSRVVQNTSFSVHPQHSRGVEWIERVEGGLLWGRSYSRGEMLPSVEYGSILVLDVSYDDLPSVTTAHGLTVDHAYFVPYRVLSLALVPRVQGRYRVTIRVIDEPIEFVTFTPEQIISRQGSSVDILVPNDPPSTLVALVEGRMTRLTGGIRTPATRPEWAWNPPDAPWWRIRFHERDWQH